MKLLMVYLSPFLVGCDFVFKLIKIV